MVDVHDEAQKIISELFTTALLGRATVLIAIIPNVQVRKSRQSEIKGFDQIQAFPIC